MKGFIGFTKRNLLIYFKDKQAILFSLLTSIIVFVLYLLFLKGSFVDAIESAMQGLEDVVNKVDIEMLANGILLVGILGSALITVPFNCLSTIVSDREKKIDYDISATPMRRWQIVLSYFVASTISAFLMTGVILTVGLLVLSGLGDMHIQAVNIVAAYAIVFLGAVSATAFFMIVVLFFKSSQACSAFFGMLSSAAGFVIGAYIPISQFSDGVQTFCNLFPASHVTILFRNVILNGLLDEIDNCIGGLDQGMFVSSMKECFTFEAQLFGNSLSQSNMICYVAGAAVLCVVIMIFVYARTYKRK